jgi:SAM-dependent methyltransferase
MSTNTETIKREKNRIEVEYRRREAEIDADLYAPWQPAENFILAERKALAAFLLKKAGKFPQADDKCLEIGYGRLGWLADLISWGLRENDLHGIELDAKRAAQAQAALPNADLRVGNAVKLPWEDESFNLVVVSTVFSSVLNLEIRHLMAGEINRILVNGGVLVWYDLAVNNPKNPNVKGIKRLDLMKLFPKLKGTIKSVTLAPPIARLVVPKSFTLAAILNTLPFLRTHLLAVLIKSKQLI